MLVDEGLTVGNGLITMLLLLKLKVQPLPGKLMNTLYTPELAT